MNRLSVITIGLVIGLCSACDKHNHDFVPDIKLSVDRIEEKTTHEFIFTVSTAKPISQTERLYCRFDWEGDSIWDTPFSQDLEVKHRFYQPGSYTIWAEFLTKGGYTESKELKIEVEQGYSAPHADFLTLPSHGHILTQFLFDGSITFDDEDSLNSLRFRWDFYDDGSWDTPYLDTPLVQYQFKLQGKHAIKMAAFDPTNRSANRIHYVDVGIIDSLIMPVIQISPEDGTVRDEYLFDASQTYHQTDENRRFLYSWKLPDHPYADPVKDTVVRMTFDSPGMKTIRLKVIDQYGLENTVTRDFYVSMGNRPPTAAIEVAIPYGNIGSQFYFNTWQSRDDKTPGSAMGKRWDFNGDGVWDTPITTEQEIYHQFAVPGQFTVYLELTDEEGDRDTASIVVDISPYNHPTGILRDSRDNKLYGTVKIGKQWWMAENLDFRDQHKMNIPMIQKCYNEDPALCDKYGSLYLLDRVIDYHKKGKNVCPDGWHWPTKEELDELVALFPEENSREAIEVGGSLGFNGLFTGHGTYFFVYDSFGNIRDTVWQYRDQGVEGYAASNYYRTNYKLNFYVMEYNKNSPEGWAYIYPGDRYYPIRCVKD